MPKTRRPSVAKAPAPAADTRSRILEAARYLFWERGYTATGLSELLARADANSGSFYHFFESKDALLREVLETYADLFEPLVLRPAWQQTSDPMARVFALLDGYRAKLLVTDCQYGCPIGRLALELDPENRPAHALIARNFTGWTEAVRLCLEAARVPDAADAASFVLTVMEGAVMQSRAYRSIDPFDASIRQLRKHLGGGTGLEARERKPIPSSRTSTPKRSKRHA